MIFRKNRGCPHDDIAGPKVIVYQSRRVETHLSLPAGSRRVPTVVIGVTGTFCFTSRIVVGKVSLCQEHHEHREVALFTMS